MNWWLFGICMALVGLLFVAIYTPILRSEVRYMLWLYVTALFR